MLTRLNVTNVALIKRLEVEFGPGLNILSGETGAGKSIVVDSLMLLLGARYDRSLLRFGESAGCVEGVFEAEDTAALLTDVGFEPEELIILTRRFGEDGKNDIRLNGRQITLSMLRLLASRLIDIYGQGEYQSLLKTSEHLKILDHNLRESLSSPKRDYEKNLSRLKTVNVELAGLGRPDERERNIDILSYQLKEIESAAVKEGEEEELMERRRLAANARRITEAASQAAELLAEGETSVLSGVAAAAVKVQFAAGYDKTYGELSKRLESVSIDLEDIAETLKDELTDIDLDESELDKLEGRLEIIRGLKRKYGAPEEMNEFYRNASDQLNRLRNCGELFASLTGEKERLLAELYDTAAAMSHIRREGAAALEGRVISELSELGMENSVFKVVFAPLPGLSEAEARFGPDGLDEAEFYLSPNPGRPPMPLVKIISGGEMSRLMLALKVISSAVNDVPTMIFDEVDAGISGKVGQAVAQKLYRIATLHQVLCVTHLPQIAAMADRHFYISKSAEGGDTLTTVIKLSEEQSVEEISRLSGGSGISSKSGLNAREMKRWSAEYKKSMGKPIF